MIMRDKTRVHVLLELVCKQRCWTHMMLDASRASDPHVYTALRERWGTQGVPTRRCSCTESKQAHTIRWSQAGVAHTILLQLQCG